MTDEGWMNVPIIFPPIPTRDLSKEALVVKAEVKSLGKIELDVCFGGEREMPKSNYEVHNHPGTFTLQHHLRTSRPKATQGNPFYHS
ncbi:hypothetical protein Tco_1402710 [Tanacetum coccineum]